VIRTLKNITFNKTEMATSINIRSLPQKTIMLTSTEITEIIENIPNASDANIANANDTTLLSRTLKMRLLKIL
jgi:hypothetical protein